MLTSLNAIFMTQEQGHSIFSVVNENTQVINLLNINI